VNKAFQKAAVARELAMRAEEGSLYDKGRSTRNGKTDRKGSKVVPPTKRSTAKPKRVFFLSENCLHAPPEGI